MPRKTLEERCRKLFYRKNGLTYPDHVRAELDRLARQVRKLDDKSEDGIFVAGYYQALYDVLKLIREAKQ